MGEKPLLPTNHAVAQFSQNLLTNVRCRKMPYRSLVIDGQMSGDIVGTAPDDAFRATSGFFIVSLRVQRMRFRLHAV